MAWVRIHDGAMSHPKVVQLSDKAFRLWVWGLSYAQQHLTDGLIPAVIVPGRLHRATAQLMETGLWSAAAGDFQIHDYLDWNDAKDLIVKKRLEAKERMAQARVRANFGRSSTLGRVGSSSLEREHERKPWECPHVDRCESPQICANATYLGRPVKAVAS